MDLLIFIILLNLSAIRAKFCETTKAPFEVGHWRGHMKHLDSATVEITPVSASEGQIYVYENTFPGFIIKYVNVDNLAQKTCGASASVKQGGVGAEYILIVLHAAANQEIRSVIDVWGVKEGHGQKRVGKSTMRSRYLFHDMRTVNHNAAFVNGKVFGQPEA